MDTREKLNDERGSCWPWIYGLLIPTQANRKGHANSHRSHIEIQAMTFLQRDYDVLEFEDEGLIRDLDKLILYK